MVFLFSSKCPIHFTNRMSLAWTSYSDFFIQWILEQPLPMYSYRKRKMNAVSGYHDCRLNIRHSIQITLTNIQKCMFYEHLMHFDLLFTSTHKVGHDLCLSSEMSTSTTGNGCTQTVIIGVNEKLWSLCLEAAP